MMYNMNKEELLPNNDVVFKRLFGKAKKTELLKDFIEGVVDIEIKSLELRKRNSDFARNNR